MPSIFDNNEYLGADEVSLLERLNEQYAPQPTLNEPLLYGGRPVFSGTGYVDNRLQFTAPLPYGGRPVFSDVGYSPNIGIAMQTPMSFSRNPYSPFDPKPNYNLAGPNDVGGLPFIPQTGGEFRVTDSGASKEAMLAQAIGMQANNLTPAQLQRLATINRQFDNSESIANRNMSRYGTPALASYEQDLAIARATANADMLNRYSIDTPDAGGAAGGRSMGGGGGSGGGGSGGGTTRAPARPFGSGGDPLNTGGRTPPARPRVGAGLPPIRPGAGAPTGLGALARPGTGAPARPRAGAPTGLATAMSGLTQLANFLIGKEDFTKLQNMGLIKYIKGAFGNDKIIALRPDGSVAGTIAEANEDNPDTYSVAGGGYAVFGSDGLLRITNNNGEVTDILDGEPDQYNFDDDGNLTLVDQSVDYEPDLRPTDYTTDRGQIDPYEVDQAPDTPPDPFEIPEVELPPYVPPPEIELEPDYFPYSDPDPFNFGE